MKSNKGQAALEYLTTYGWAIFAIIASIGAIGYFTSGASTNIPDRCTMGNGFECVATAFSNHLSGIYELKNTMGEDINITNVICEFDNPGKVSHKYNNTIVKAGETFIGWCDERPVPSTVNIQKQSKMELVIYYKTLDTNSLPKSIRGEIVFTPQESVNRSLRTIFTSENAVYTSN